MPHYSLKDANFRVFLNQRQGGRKYMEDVVMIRDHNTEKTDQEFVFWAVFDGHGGAEAAKYAREHLLDELKKLKGFWSTDQDEVSKAIKEAFIITHKLMWKNVGKWPKTLSGLPSTAGTTASVVIVKDSKMYVAHVGDSSVVIGEEKATWQRYIANCITTDHKPEDPCEKKRIEESGGQVVAKAGVQRVVWHRPKPTHKGPVRRSTRIDDIPFLAVARALGDLWSYNSEHDMFVVSPEPDIAVLDFDPKKHKFVILASDGLWNMVKPEHAVAMVEEMEERDAHKFSVGYNPAIKLVSLALDKWATRKMRADNTSVILAMIDPPGHDPSPMSHSNDQQLSNASTVVLSDTETVTPTESPKTPIINSHFPGINRHRYWDDLFPSPRHIGFGGHISAKHINAVTGKTPKMHKLKHSRSKTPKSCPPKMHTSTSGKQKPVHMNKYTSNPVHVNGISPEYLNSNSNCHPNGGIGASPVLTTNKRKASTEQPEGLINRISPLQGSPRKRRSSECGPSSPKKRRRTVSSPCKSEMLPITGMSDDDYVSEEVVVSTSEMVSVSALPELPNCDRKEPQEMAATVDGPMVGTSAKSPLKVDTQQNSPTLGVVSPIWPSCLEKDIDMDAAGSDAMCSITVTTSLTNCVLRENSPKSNVAAKVVAPKKTTYAKVSSKHFGGSQNKVSKAGIRRKSPQGNMTRITVHKLRIRSKRPFKLRNTQHRTRLQANGTSMSSRRS